MWGFRAQCPDAMNILKKDYYFDIWYFVSLLYLFFLQNALSQCRDDFLRVSILPHNKQSSLLPPPEVLHHHPSHTEKRSGLSHLTHHRVAKLSQLTHCKSTTSSTSQSSLIFYIQLFILLDMFLSSVFCFLVKWCSAPTQSLWPRCVISWCSGPPSSPSTPSSSSIASGQTSLLFQIKTHHASMLHASP